MADRLIEQASKILKESLSRNIYSDISPYDKSIGKQTDKQKEISNNIPTDIDRNKIYNNSKVPIVGNSPLTKPLSYIPPPLPGDKNSTPIQGQIRNNFSDSHRLGNLYDDKSPLGGFKSGIKDGIESAAKSIGVKGGTFALPMPSPTNYLDIFATAHWLRNIAKEFGILPIQDNFKGEMTRPGNNIAKGITFAASQAVLTALNFTDPAYGSALNAIWNPFSVVASCIPFLRPDAYGVSPIGAAAAGLTYKDSLQSAGIVGDRHQQMRIGAYVESPNGQMLTQLRSAKKGFVGDIAKVGDYHTIKGWNASAPSTIEGQVDQEGTMGDVAKLLPIAKNLYTDKKNYYENYINNSMYISQEEILKQTRTLEKTPGIPPEFAIDKANDLRMATLFKAQKYPGGGLVAKGQALSWMADPALASTKTNSISRDTPENLSARFEGEEDGLLKSQIDDSDVYVPLMFQDLRDGTDKNSKFLYFRAFIRDGFTETFTPRWNIQSYFGRVDDVPIYQNTSRVVNLSFDVLAWTPVELPVIYRKIHKLQSMVYPLFDEKGFMQSGPIIRMRLGDLLSAQSKLGLPGYLTSLDFSYDDSLWSIEKDLKAPMKITVTLSFTILHEGNPGIYLNKTVQVFPDGSITGDKDVNFGVATFDVDSSNILTIESFPSKIRGIIQKVDGYYEELRTSGVQI
jgi:hypothetical protein